MATHVFQNLPNTISTVFEVDGEPTSAGTVTVTITRDSDGTTLVSSGATTAGSTGEYKYSLTPTQTASLDLLTVVWSGTSPSGIKNTTYVEVVGAPLFSIQEARARSSMADKSVYTDAQIAFVRQAATEAIEDACNGVAFTPRYGSFTTDATNTGIVSLPDRKVTSLLSGSNAGTALTASELAAWYVYPGGMLKNRTPLFWTQFRQITFKYYHGWTYCPQQVKLAALDLAEYWLAQPNSGISPRMTSMSTQDGSFALATAGMRGLMFDLPSVQAAVNRYAWSNAASVL